jgi:hypothetical protein
MKKHFLLLFFALYFLAGYAQIKNDSLEYRIRPDELRAGELYLSIHNFNFLRNYEFFNRFQDGYTLFGTQMEPQLIYYPHDRLAITAGLHLRKDFGGTGIYKTYPLFSIKYRQGYTLLINGVLEGNIQHRYIEPIFDFEKKIVDPIEYGTQFIIDKPSLFLDAYINWKRMIYKPSSEQEQIFAGSSADITLIKTLKSRLSIPLQLLVFHKGGQIDTGQTPPIQTLVNTAAGFRLEVSSAGFIKNFHTDNYIVGYKEFSPTKVQAFLRGHGFYLNAGIDSEAGSLGLSYWNGNGYISPAGMPVFQSVSQQINNAGYSEKQRELLFVRYAYQKQLIPNLYLDFRIEPVIDLKASGSKVLDFYHSTFLVYKQEFRLLKKK